MMVELNVSDLSIHCKKRFLIFLSQTGMSNFLWPGIIKLFPARESLVGDIPAGDGKIDYLFNSVLVQILQGHDSSRAGSINRFTWKLSCDI
jgi:hypothetical protein